MVRFDTNGMTFGNDKYSDLFFSSLFKLFIRNKLKNIHIQIDFSFKGATSTEFMWSQSQKLPTTEKNNDKKIDIKKHPQARGYQNIISNIKKYIKKEPGFNECVSITVEKGIDNDWKKSKLWLYYPHSLNWENWLKN